MDSPIKIKGKGTKESPSILSIETFGLDLQDMYVEFPSCAKMEGVKYIQGGHIVNTDGTDMFKDFQSLTSFNSDLSSLKNGMFMFEDCSSLSSFTSDLSSLTSGQLMFEGCKSLTSFTSKLSSLTDGNRMFEGCKALTSFSNDLDSLRDGTNMFRDCTSLETFESDLSNLKTGGLMFYGCNSLQSVKIKCTEANKALMAKYYLKIRKAATLEVSTDNGATWEVINE